MWRYLLIALTASLAACAEPVCCAPEPEPERPERLMHEIMITVEVPEASGPVYLAGNAPELGPWAADALLMQGEGRERRAVISLPDGFAFEYKVTLGSWDREGLADPAGVPRNFQLVADAAQSVRHTIDHWKRPTSTYLDDWQGSGVLGELVCWRDVVSEHLEPARHVEIWLPPGYRDSEARYPVIYMHDGQNLFDPRIANTGVDWGVDEAIMRGVDAGRIRPAIIVGIWTGELRAAELSPWDRGDNYARFLVEELMPRVDAEFRTLTGPEHTFVMGSSMGGLASFHLIRNYPDVFGACGCISTHFPFNWENHAWTMGVDLPEGVDPERALILDDIEAGMRVPQGVRMWFDYGTETLDAIYEPSHMAVRDWLLAQGFQEGEDFIMRRYDGAAHNEASWRARLDDPLSFLLAVEE